MKKNGVRKFYTKFFTLCAMAVLAWVALLVIAAKSAETKDPNPFLYENTQIITEDNHSYIKILRNDSVQHYDSQYHEYEILVLVRKFEIHHPELEVTEWKLHTRPFNGHSWGDTFGIWIDHKPKSDPCK